MFKTFSGTNQKPERQRAVRTGVVRHCPRGSSRRSLLFLVPYFPARSDSPSPPLSAPGSLRMVKFKTTRDTQVTCGWSFIYLTISEVRIYLTFSTNVLNNLNNLSVKYIQPSESAIKQRIYFTVEFQELLHNINSEKRMVSIFTCFQTLSPKRSFLHETGFPHY